MERHSLRLKSFLLAGLLVATGAPAALALEADAVGERLKALLDRQQIDIAYGAARLSGDDVVLEDVTVRSEAGGGALPLGELVLEDVREEGDGSLVVGTVAMDDFRHQADDVTVSLTDLRIEGLVLPADLASDPFGGAMRYERMEVARLDVEGRDGPIATLENAHADVAIAEDDTMTVAGVADSFSLNLRAMMADSANAAAALAELGYEQLRGHARMEGSWRPSDGRVTLANYEATIENAGTLNIMVDFAGYTPAFITTMEELSDSMEESGGQNNSAQGMAMLGMMQQLTFHGMTLRFTDDSLTGRLLDYTARKQGSRPADVIAQAKAVIPMQLKPYLGEELTGALTEAVGDFLENPETLEISARPETPVPFAMLMGAAMGSPDLLIKQIGLAVTANR